MVAYTIRGWARGLQPLFEETSLIMATLKQIFEKFIFRGREEVIETRWNRQHFRVNLLKPSPEAWDHEQQMEQLTCGEICQCPTSGIVGDNFQLAGPEEMFDRHSRQFTCYCP
jgi:hypothetical protein